MCLWLFGFLVYDEGDKKEEYGRPESHGGVKWGFYKYESRQGVDSPSLPIVDMAGSAERELTAGVCPGVEVGDNDGLIMEKRNGKKRV